MQKLLKGRLIPGAFMLALTGIVIQMPPFAASGPASAVAATGDYSRDGDGFLWRRPKPPKPPVKVPEPATIALLAAGAAGLGVFGLIRRRNRK